MSAPLLKTKLYQPRVRPGLISRPRLIECLNAGLRRELTLVSAPAGFGKTTLLSEWINRRGAVARPQEYAWLSLDSGDNDLNRFLAYLIGAIRTVESEFGQEALLALQSPGDVNSEAVLITLLNELSELPGDMVLILDDYHVIESRPVDQAIAFLLDHLPSGMHLVIASRIDPSLPLSRLRARGQLTEIRVRDLRFTTDEAADFLCQIMGFDLSSQDVAALAARTEGWVAGLQLAALSMQDLKEGTAVSDFISKFAGSDHFIRDYLVDEVLRRRPKGTKDFLLQTCILERLCAPLCDAVRLGLAEAEGDKSDSQEILESLEASNLFIVPLDNERTWYRYHHLFSDLLRHRLFTTFPGRIDELHACASQWLEENGFPDQAIKHALAMEDKNLTADLIERHATTFLYEGMAQTNEMLSWFDMLPEEIVQARPLLHVFKAWTLLLVNPFKNKKAVEQVLEHVQQSQTKMDLSSSTERQVSGHVASIQGYLSQPPIQTDHDPHAVLALFHKALRLLPPDTFRTRSDVFIGIAYEYMHLEDADAALKANQCAFSEACAADNYRVAIIALRNQAMISYYSGALAQAVELCNEGMALTCQTRSKNAQPVPGLEFLSIALGFLLVERGELEKAEIELAKGFDSLQLFSEYETRVLGQIALARLQLIKGETNWEQHDTKRSERQRSGMVELAITLSVQKALSRLESNSSTLQTILDWVREHQPDLAVSDFQGITPWAETQHLIHMTWIQAQVALSGLESCSSDEPTLYACLDYLDRRLQTAEQRGLVFRVIECAVMRALVFDTLGNTKEATISLSRALAQAAPENYRRVFLDKGPSMAQLLQKVAELGRSAGFIRQLLVQYERPGEIKAQSAAQKLIEPLSERELEVLRLLAKGLSNRQISDRLFLALDTVKGHNYRIYGKLGVRNRTRAVRRAISLKIIPPHES